MEIVLAIGFVILIFFVFAFKERGLSDPNNNRFIYVEQMEANHQLRDGPVSAALFRQSGNLYRDLGGFHDAASAMREIQKSFRRAKIDSVAVIKSTDTHFEVMRLHHNHRGRAEGKKLGGAVIVTV